MGKEMFQRNSEAQPIAWQKRNQDPKDRDQASCSGGSSGSCGACGSGSCACGTGGGECGYRPDDTELPE